MELLNKQKNNGGDIVSLLACTLKKEFHKIGNAKKGARFFLKYLLRTDKYEVFTIGAYYFKDDKVNFRGLIFDVMTEISGQNILKGILRTIQTEEETVG